jgi:hypothetical protein
MVVALNNGNSKQRLQFYLPIYEPERYPAIFELAEVIPAFFCGSRMLVWVFHHNKSREECIRTLEAYLLSLLRIGIYSHWSEFPRLPREGGTQGNFHTMRCWTDKLEWSEFESVVFKLCEPLQENYINITHFLRCGKNQIYSIWNPGEVPQEVIERHGIQAEELLFEDQHGNDTESGAIA